MATPPTIVGQHGHRLPLSSVSVNQPDFRRHSSAALRVTPFKLYRWQPAIRDLGRLHRLYTVCLDAGHDVHHREATLDYLPPRFGTELIRALLAVAHKHLGHCHQLWQLDVYERLAGPRAVRDDQGEQAHGGIPEKVPDAIAFWISGRYQSRFVAPLRDDGFHDVLIRYDRAWTCHQKCAACRRRGRRVERRAPYLDGMESCDWRRTLGTRSAEPGHAGHAKKDRARIRRLCASRGAQAEV
ncbi:hypothetical protein QE400_001250 [Xanthomonas sacchari]|nr:hypothetical protein [Xanthomonas sacchari]